MLPRQQGGRPSAPGVVRVWVVRCGWPSRTFVRSSLTWARSLAWLTTCTFCPPAFVPVVSSVAVT
eukprot:12892530-Prorocentrum_lima.AAC.1